MKNYVGAIGVQSNEVYCRKCLIGHEILYIGGSEISASKARSGHLRCVSCGETLYTPRQRTASTGKHIALHQ